MCDTFVVLPDATQNRRLLFAKNSDRERNEAQWLEHVGRQEHAAGSTVDLTYIRVPQVARTHAVLLSRPFWTWGAEMGANEHGVVIGNEAMHAIIPANRRRALIGMDLVRLALERASDAQSAAEIMIALLEQFNQGGNCGHYGRFYYNNGFIIADPKRAFVLETVGRWWVLEEVCGLRALSNAYSIGAGYASISPSLQAHAEQNGWAESGGRFDFAEHMTDRERDAVTWGRGRCARGTELLERERGSHTLATMMAILRDHGPNATCATDWDPDQTVGRTICMHAGSGPRRGQTTGSMVSEIVPDAASVHWVTGSSAPCTSIFKPIVLGIDLPLQEPVPTDTFDSRTFWWRHELLHRCVLDDFAARLATFRAERDRLEARFQEYMNHVMLQQPMNTSAITAAIVACWDEAGQAEARWHRELQVLRSRQRRDSPSRRSWSRLNRLAGLPS